MHQSEIVAKLAATIKSRREELHITQDYLAGLSKVGLRTLKEIETGKGNPTVETLARLADVLGMELKLEVKKTTASNP